VTKKTSGVGQGARGGDEKGVLRGGRGWENSDRGDDYDRAPHDAEEPNTSVYPERSGGIKPNLKASEPSSHSPDVSPQ
jgi:hypothetical protein